MLPHPLADLVPRKRLFRQGGIMRDFLCPLRKRARAQQLPNGIRANQQRSPVVDIGHALIAC